MRKIIAFILTFMMIIPLASCGDEPTSKKSTSTGGGSTSDSLKNEEAKVYGIGESAEINGLSITIDKTAIAKPNTTLEKAKDGFEHIKIWFTFKNISNETIESPRKSSLYIVYNEGATGDDSVMKSDDNSLVMLDVADRNERYMSSVDLAPDESTSGWIIYQKQTDKSVVTMHYYSRFVNTAPGLVFKFTV